MVQVVDAPAGLEYHPRDLGHLEKVDLVDRIGGPVVVNMNPIKVKNDGYTVLRVVPVVGTKVNALRIIGIVVIVIQL